MRLQILIRLFVFLAIIGGRIEPLDGSIIGSEAAQKWSLQQESDSQGTLLEDKFNRGFKAKDWPLMEVYAQLLAFHHLRWYRLTGQVWCFSRAMYWFQGSGIPPESINFFIYSTAKAAEMDAEVTSATPANSLRIALNLYRYVGNKSQVESIKRRLGFLGPAIRGALPPDDTMPIGETPKGRIAYAIRPFLLYPI